MPLSSTRYVELAEKVTLLVVSRPGLSPGEIILVVLMVILPTVPVPPNVPGTLIMFAVRRALTNRDRVTAVVGQLIESGAIDGRAVDRDDPLGFVASHRGVRSLIEAAYRFCRHEPGAHVILTGTGSVGHLRENVEAILAPPLPEELSARLERIFGNVDSVSGD